MIPIINYISCIRTGFYLLVHPAPPKTIVVINLTHNTGNVPKSLLNQSVGASSPPLLSCDRKVLSGFGMKKEILFFATRTFIRLICLRINYIAMVLIYNENLFTEWKKMLTCGCIRNSLARQKWMSIYGWIWKQQQCSNRGFWRQGREVGVKYLSVAVQWRCFAVAKKLFL